MKSKTNKTKNKIVSVLLLLSIFVGIFPMAVTADGGTVGESLENPILISEMDQLIEEMEKNVTSPTYYKLTEDVSHETSIKYFDGREDETGDDELEGTSALAGDVTGEGRIGSIDYLRIKGHFLGT